MGQGRGHTLTGQLAMALQGRAAPSAFSVKSTRSQMSAFDPLRTLARFRPPTLGNMPATLLFSGDEASIYRLAEGANIERGAEAARLSHRRMGDDRHAPHGARP